MNFYLYRHIRLDKNEPFYVGIGSIVEKDKLSSCQSRLYRRAFSKSDRNPHWKSIVKSIPYEVEIILRSDDYTFIKQKEIEFIALYGRECKGGLLTNINEGGDGNLGYKHSEETRKKISEVQKGKKKSPRPFRNLSEEHKLNVGKGLKGKYTRENHWHTGIKRPKEIGEKISKANKGRKYGLEFGEKIRKRQLEKFKDKVFSEEERVEMGRRRKGKGLKALIRTINDNEEFYISFTEVQQKLDILTGSLHAIIKHNRKDKEGGTWRYA